MKRTFLTIPALAFVLLSGCAALQDASQAATGTISSLAPDTFNAAKKALTAAHDLHKSTAVFLTIAANTNLCHATCASTAKVYLDQSEGYLAAADKLVAVSDAAGIEAKIKSATALISQVNSLISGKN